ncbi:hypothetical protein C8R46DRAFT_1058955 [Mycena filopes]|nr:hypothetical protein C8R46DRAFT_1058955 [Mycena filopes]
MGTLWAIITGTEAFCAQFRTTTTTTLYLIAAACGAIYAAPSPPFALFHFIPTRTRDPEGPELIPGGGIWG